MPKKPTKIATPPALAPAMSPFDVERSPEAQRHLAATISQITLDFLSKGLRQVGVPLGQANAVKAAFENIDPSQGTASGEVAHDVFMVARPRRWHVEIAKTNGLLAELHFTIEGDPVASVPASVLLPRVDELLAWARANVVDPHDVVFGDDSPLGKILGNLRVLRAMVDG